MVFTGGIGLGPTEAARHIDTAKVEIAMDTVVGAFNELDVVKAWGDGASVVADGTQACA